MSVITYEINKRCLKIFINGSLNINIHSIYYNCVYSYILNKDTDKPIYKIRVCFQNNSIFEFDYMDKSIWLKILNIINKNL